MATGTILVTGANGFVGRHVVRELLARGRHVVCFVKRGTDDTPLRGLDVEVRAGDLRDRGSVVSAVAGAEAVIHLAAAVNVPTDQYDAVNVLGAANIAAACRENRVDRLIAYSSVTVTRARMGAYGRTKKEAERVLGEAGLNTTVFRPELIYGVGSPGLGKIARQVRAYPLFIPVVGRGDTVLQPVYVKDIARLTADTVEDPLSHGKVYDVGGRDPVSARELILAVAREMGVGKRLLHVPPSIALVAAYGLGVALRSPPFTVDNMLGLMVPNNNDVQRTFDELGFSPTPLADALRETFREWHPSL